MSEQPSAPTIADIDAERAILSALLQEQAAIENLRLQPDDFSTQAHRTLYSTMTDLWANNCPLTPGLIFHDLVRSKQVAQASPADGKGAKAYLAELLATGINPDHIQHYAGIVAKLARVRKYVKMSADVIKRAYDQADPDELDGMINNALISLNGGQNDALLTWHDSFPAYEKILDARALAVDNPTAGNSRWAFPWESWNILVDDPGPGFLGVIGGGTSVGKTVFGENIAEGWARNGHKIAYFHFELDRELMLDRRSVRYTGYKRRELLGKLSPETRQHIREVNAALDTWIGGVEYIHCPDWTMDQVVTQIRSMHAAGLCDGFIIDYLEKAQGSDQQWKRYRDEYKIEADNVNKLKNVAEQLGLRGILLAQFTKDGNDLPFDQLYMSKIRGAGQKSERANMVALIHRERIETTQYDASGRVLVEAGQRGRETKVRIDKNTMGQPGVAEMTMQASMFLVVDKKPEEGSEAPNPF